MYKRQRHTLLSTFEKELQQKDLIDSFLHSEWTKGYEAGLQAFLQHTEALRKELEIGQSLQQFSDLDNPDSLARWALSLHRPLSRAEESLIIHFQDLKRHKPISPKARNRYPVSYTHLLLEVSMVFPLENERITVA